MQTCLLGVLGDATEHALDNFHADEVDISGGGMTSRRNSTAAQQETEKDGTQTEVGDGR